MKGREREKGAGIRVSPAQLPEHIAKGAREIAAKIAPLLKALEDY